MTSIEVYARPGDTVYSFSDDTNVVREWTILKVVAYPNENIYHVRDATLAFLAYSEKEFMELFFHSKAEAVAANTLKDS